MVYSYAIKKFVLKNNGNLPKSLLHLREDNYCNNVNFCPISSKIYSYRLENLKDIEINNLAPDEIIIFCSGCKKGLRCDGKITESISLALMDKPVKKQQDSRVFVSAALYDSFDRKTIPFIKEVTITPQDHEGEKMLQKFKQYMQKLKIIEPEVERAPEMDKLGRSKAYRRLSIIELQQKILEVDMQFAVDRNFVLNSYRVKNFDSGEAMFKNIPPGKYIVTAYGAHHNVNCRWFFAVEKTKYKPLKINLTNDDNCFIQVTKEVIIKPQIKQFAR